MFSHLLSHLCAAGFPSHPRLFEILLSSYFHQVKLSLSEVFHLLCFYYYNFLKKFIPFLKNLKPLRLMESCLLSFGNGRIVLTPAMLTSMPILH